MSGVAEKTTSAIQRAPGDVTPGPVTLLRQLGVASATAIVISNMIGQGIFTTTGFLAGDLGAPRLVLTIWIVGALFALAGAFCYSELGINFPSSGGEYVYLTRAYGPTWGFISGWVSFFAGFSAPVAATALAFSKYLTYFFPDLDQAWFFVRLGGDLTLSFGPAQLVASGLIAALTVINIFGVSRVAKFQNMLTGVNLVVILAFIALAVFAGNGNWANFGVSAQRSSSHSIPAQFAISLFWIYVCYSGWNAATYIAEELKRPERTLPAALTFGTALVAAIYLALNVVFIYALPLTAMKTADGKPVVEIGAAVARALFGPQMAGMLSGLIALCLVATVNAMVTIGPRVYYAMAQNGAFLRAAGQVHPRWRTPVAAILFQGVCAVVMTLTPFPSLVVYIGFTLTFCALLAVCSLFIFRRRQNWQRLGVVSFAWPLIPVAFVVVAGWMMVYGLMLRPGISVAAVLTVATGAAVYHFRIRKS